MQTHKLKTWTQFFEPVVAGEKTFEVRRNDRGFNAGDIVRLIEVTGEDGEIPTGRHGETYTPTGREVVRRIGYVYAAPPLPPGYVIFSILEV